MTSYQERWFGPDINWRYYQGRKDIPHVYGVPGAGDRIENVGCVTVISEES